jgi:hypothetical protein
VERLAICFRSSPVSFNRNCSDTSREIFRDHHDVAHPTAILVAPDEVIITGIDQLYGDRQVIPPPPYAPLQYGADTQVAGRCLDVFPLVPED